MNTITITLPLPARELSPNARVHWARKAKAARSAKIGAYALTVNKYGKAIIPWRKARIQIRWYHKTLRFPDNDNCIGWCKAYRDGMCAAGYLQDDRDIKEISIDINKDSANPRVEITLSEIKENADEN